MVTSEMIENTTNLNLDTMTEKNMTKRQFWLKLFSENDVALATAIHLCQRFTDEESLKKSQEFIYEKVKELDDEVSKEQIEDIFGQKA